MNYPHFSSILCWLMLVTSNFSPKPCHGCRLLSLLGTQQMQETPQLAFRHHLGLQRYCEASLGVANMGDLWGAPLSW